jgi:hypothetical protein
MNSNMKIEIIKVISIFLTKELEVSDGFEG